MPRRALPCTLLRLALPSVTLLLMAVPLSAAVITVDTTADSLAVDSSCSLREAILAANTNQAVDSCTAGDAGPPVTDVIVVPAGGYQLSVGPAGDDTGASGDLDLTDDVQLVGAAGGGAVIDAAGLDRAFDVQGGVTAVLVNLTITGGATSGNGGGIQNGGELTVLACTVEGNSADGPGGGIRNNSVLHVVRSTLSGNTTQDHGGGVDSHGTMTVIGSTVVGNSVIGGGAGGGLYVLTGETATIADTTISGNSAGAGEGLHCGGTVELANSIVAGGCDAPVTGTLGGNLESPGNSCGLGIGDLAGVGNPLLGALADNGGPTPTLLPEAASPALDAGAGCAGLDQRGAGRPIDGDALGGAECDAGAVEFGSPVPIFRDGLELGHAQTWSLIEG